MTRGITLRSALASIVFVFAITVAGCAPQQTDYDPDIADRLQGEVLEVSQLSANADFTSALLGLSELEVELKDARARGLLTEERYESIMAALALVRADLEAAIAAQAPSPAPESEGGEEDGGDGGGDQGDGGGDKGNDNKGKGNSDDD
ncbi:MAG TPA: hypothetical protein VFT01_03200 [Homoserinimonas sp.]|nr:hypothetical protein [Homoserinimonas sp.]